MRLFLCLALVLAACDRRPPIPTATENRDLDEAANLLDDAEENLAVVDSEGLAPENQTSR